MHYTISPLIKSDRSRLPSINIESFSGDYHKWTAFKSLFQSLVHEKSDNFILVQKVDAKTHKHWGKFIDRSEKVAVI